MEWKGKGNKNKVVEWRRHLHAHPEVAFQEQETSAYIAGLLESFGVEVLRPTETSVVGVLKGTKPGKTVGLRADIDALPMQEESGVPFASEVPGVMHACGHDAHTAMLLGAAQVLSGMREELCGTVKFIFQAAEEQFPGGAAAIVDSGVLDGTDYIFGSHIVANQKTGAISCWPGPATASPDMFLIELEGKGAHGATPHESIDPVTIGAQIVVNLNSIVSRNVSPLDNVVVTVAKFVADSSFNIIPPRAVLGGTIRTYSNEVRESVHKRMDEIVAGICQAYGATYKLSITGGYDPVFNDDVCVDMVHEVARELYGDDVLIRPRTLMAGDDFSAFRRVAPTGFMLIGCGTTEQGYGYQAHHPKFSIDEDMLPVGVDMFVGCTLKATGTL